jgi:hypothetical protein
VKPSYIYVKFKKKYAMPYIIICRVCCKKELYDRTLWDRLVEKVEISNQIK